MNKIAKKALAPAAARALEEARIRREAMVKVQQVEQELGGPKGPEPSRYGDWELKGRAVDF